MTPEALAGRMAKLARSNPPISLFRLSGAETLIGPRSALFCAALAVQLRALSGTSQLLLETNGLGLGVFGKEMTDILAAAGDALEVRLCLKGVSPQSFAKVTGRPPEWFSCVLRGIAALEASAVPHHLAIMDKLLDQFDLAPALQLEREQPEPEVVRLLANTEIEVEHLNNRYAGVKARLQARGLDW